MGYGLGLAFLLGGMGVFGFFIGLASAAHMLVCQ
jgi:hypothetical protein